MYFHLELLEDFRQVENELLCLLQAALLLFHLYLLKPVPAAVLFLADAFIRIQASAFFAHCLSISSLLSFSCLFFLLLAAFLSFLDHLFLLLLDDFELLVPVHLDQVLQLEVHHLVYGSDRFSTAFVIWAAKLFGFLDTGQHLALEVLNI